MVDGGRRRALRVSLAQDQPVLRIAVELGRHERPHAFEPLAVETDGEPAVLLLLDELVGAPVPDFHGAGAVLTGRDLPLEVGVVERVVLDVDGECALAGLEWNALRYRPARERPVALQAKVVVEPAGVVALDDEDRPCSALLGAERLRSSLRIALTAVIGQLISAASHDRTLPAPD